MVFNHIWYIEIDVGRKYRSPFYFMCGLNLRWFKIERILFWKNCIVKGYQDIFYFDIMLMLNHFNLQ